VAELTELHERIRARSPLPAEETEKLIQTRFARIPDRLAFGLERWALARKAVLDVGCSYGYCLAHFGPGSVGIENHAEPVEFCRALGLDARLLDVDAGVADVVEDAAFDVVWISDLLEHLDAPRLLLRDLAPKLKPGGRLIVYVTALPRSRVARALLRRRRLEPYAAEAHHYQFTEDTLRYLVERSGYRVESVEVPFLGAVGRVLHAHSPRLFIVATVDASNRSLLERAEARNKEAVSS
jgi:SAM-dependent methyltransferase